MMIFPPSFPFIAFCHCSHNNANVCWDPTARHGTVTFVLSCFWEPHEACCPCIRDEESGVSGMSWTMVTYLLNTVWPIWGRAWVLSFATASNSFAHMWNSLKAPCSPNTLVPVCSQTSAENTLGAPICLGNTHSFFFFCLVTCINGVKSDPATFQ